VCLIFLSAVTKRRLLKSLERQLEHMTTPPQSYTIEAAMQGAETSFMMGLSALAPSVEVERVPTFQEMKKQKMSPEKDASKEGEDRSVFKPMKGGNPKNPRACPKEKCQKNHFCKFHHREKK